MKEIIFDLQKYKFAQIIDALTCPLNRFATMEEHRCDEWHLHSHPNLLIEHYIRCGGAEEFEKRRGEFTREIEVEDSNQPALIN